MTKKYPTWSIYVMVLFGTATLIFGTWILVRALTVKNFGLQTEGTIVEYHSKRKNPQATFVNTLEYSPTFSFITKDSIKYQLRSSLYEESKSYVIGESVTIRYNLENPKNAYIENSYPWLEGLVLIVFGGITAGFSIFELKKRSLRAI